MSKMSVIVTKETDSKLHGYFLWEEDGEVEYLHCGPVRTILQSLTDVYSLCVIVHGIDEDVSRRELTEYLDILIRELTIEQIGERLGLDVPDLNRTRGAVLVDDIPENGQDTLVDHSEGFDVVLCEDITDDLIPRDTLSEQTEQLASPQQNEERDQDLRVKRERDYSKQVIQDRGHDPYADEVKSLYHNQCAFCGLSVEIPKGNVGSKYALESAHIQRAADDGPDKPPNRLSLCPFHHWAFDNGWLSLTDDHTVLVKDAPEYDGYDQLKSLDGEQIFLPDDPAKHPHPHFLQIHRQEHGFTN